MFFQGHFADAPPTNKTIWLESFLFPLRPLESLL